MLTTFKPLFGTQNRNKAARGKLAGRLPAYRRLCRGVEPLEERTVLSASPFFAGVGDLPGGETFSRAVGVSSDGTVVVGESTNADGHTEAFRWTLADGMEGLGVPDGATLSSARRVSNDGSVIVGRINAGDTESFRWEAGVMTVLPGLPGGDGLTNPSSTYGAKDVSADGSVVAGTIESDNGVEGFVWSEATGQVVGIGDLAGGDFNSRARAVSDDGTIVVGESSGFKVPKRGQQATRHAIQWTADDGMEILWSGGWAEHMSDDGSVVVGLQNGEGARWTEATGAVPLRDTSAPNPGLYSWTISGDGSLIGGSYNIYDERNERIASIGAAIWDEVHGVRLLQDVLTVEYGMDLDGWELINVWDMSYDGRTLVGPAMNPQGETEGYIVYLGDGTPQQALRSLPSRGSKPAKTARPHLSLSCSTPRRPRRSQSTSRPVTRPRAKSSARPTACSRSRSTTPNWDVPQTVNVAGIDDGDTDGDQAYSLELAPAVSTDPGLQWPRSRPTSRPRTWTMKFRRPVPTTSTSGTSASTSARAAVR